MSGQISGQVSGQMSNQAAPQQIGNGLSSNMQTLSGYHNTGNMEPDLQKARTYMTNKILEIILHRQRNAHDIPPKVFDIVRRLEEGLFKSTNSKADYMNLDTLESRLQTLIKRQRMGNQNDQFSHHLSSSSVGTMIPTPGMSHGGNSNMMVSSSLVTSMIAGNNSFPITSSNVNTLPSSGIRGIIPNGYEQFRSSLPNNSSGNSMMSTMGVQRMNSHMIPTPGFKCNNNQSYINLEPPCYNSGFSNVDSTMVSQAQQKNHINAQNSRVFHNIDNQMGSVPRSGRQQKSYGFSNGSINGGGLGMIESGLQLVNGPGTSEGYLTATHYGDSSKPLQRRFDQHQQSLQGDADGISSSNPSVSANLCVPISSIGSMMNTPNLNPVNFQAISETNFHLMANQSNLHNTQQAAHLKRQLSDLSEKMNFSSPISSKENVMESHRQQQFQQQQIFQHNRLQKMQLLSKNDSFGNSQLPSDFSNQVKPDLLLEQQNHNEVLQSQVSEQFQLPGLQNQFQQKSSELHTVDGTDNARILSHSSTQQNICSPHPHNPQQMQLMFHSHQLVAEPQNGFTSLPGNSQSNITSFMSRSLSNEQVVQEDFHGRISVLDEAQCNNISLDGSIVGKVVTSKGIAEIQSSSDAAFRSGLSYQEKDFLNQQKWILFMCHARHCPAPEGKCPEINCVVAQMLWKHLLRCSLPHCPYPRCRPTKILFSHYKHCHVPTCPVCVPTRSFLSSQLNRNINSGLPKSINSSCKSYANGENTLGFTSMSSPSVIGNSDDLQPVVKRMKIEQQIQCGMPKYESVSAPATIENHIHLGVQSYENQHGDTGGPLKSEFSEVVEVPISSAQEILTVNKLEGNNNEDFYNPLPDGKSTIFNESVSLPKLESVKHERNIDHSKVAMITEPAEHGSGTKSGKPKIKGVSLTELFTPEQIRGHIRGLRQWVGQSKAKAEKNQAMERSMSGDSCQLCAVEKLTFEPPPMYCTPCGSRIKRNAMYYAMGAGDARHYLCIPCYNEVRGDSITVDGNLVLKTKFDKKKNDEETEEWWVQCDKCEAWQHQICALFNGRRNDGGQAEYTCPNCYIAEIERGERKPLPQSAVLGAKDLPRTLLSDHIERKLFKRLKQERQERARVEGKSFDEVPGAEALVLRVVSSVDKKLDVKQRFLEIFQEENYPNEFSYKSKVILLFQKIEGVEVCLFGMYVQEFGSECQYPNQRRVYLSYLDSVKYFRPEIKTVNGEALRTFVYHEILIGYLEYCKLRGFTSCYIWACPPLKGEDYILYCHPEIQKTPKSDKLREWYIAMLRKAAKENIVVDLTNLYDHFFLSNGECKAKVTAARLPYFDGDYWPGAAEDMIYQLHQEEDGRRNNKKATIKKTLTKRALKASGQLDLSGNASKDLLLMHKLGETISPMKEDFIMVHLQHACSHCCHLMVSGNRWVCNMCKKFQLCDKCYDMEQRVEERERHPMNQRDKHVLYPVEINDVAMCTKDKDDILESEFFDTRQAFLSLCQGNHYQYDTLRRAKHSSMMVLYHLHNPTAPAFIATCNICSIDIETGQGWRCETCAEYDVCNSCYQKDGGIDHPHKLTNHPSLADPDDQNKEARQQRVVQLRSMLDLLVHASQCRSPNCPYPNCRKVKSLFRHGMQCKTRATGGCVLCAKMWYILQLHARACKESHCTVPRCKDLKEHLRRLQQQSDSRRRAAVMEMMRQRAAEVTGSAES